MRTQRPVAIEIGRYLIMLDQIVYIDCVNEQQVDVYLTNGSLITLTDDFGKKFLRLWASQVAAG